MATLWRVPMPDTFLSAWKPKYPMVQAASDAVGAVRDFANTPLGTDEQASGETLLGKAADFVGLPALQRTLSRVAYGQRLTEGKNQTLRLKDDTLEAAGAVLGAAPAAVKGLQAGKQFLMASGDVAAANAGRRIGNQKGIFAGFQSETADWDKLTEAQRRVTSGENPDYARRATGWRQDPADKQWKYEIDDRNSDTRLRDALAIRTAPARETHAVTKDAYMLTRLAPPGDMEAAVAAFRQKLGRDPHPAAPNMAMQNYGLDMTNALQSADKSLTASQEFKLGDVFHHDELYKAYPQLKDFKLEATHDLPKEIGGDILGDRIRINAALVKDPEQVRSVILHELDHGVQDIEGFGRGGNAAHIKDQSMIPMVESRGRGDMFLNAHTVQARMASTGEDADTAMAELMKLGHLHGSLKDINSNADWIRRSAQSNSADTLRAEALKHFKISREHVPLSEEEAFDAYMRLPGEVMARNTQARRNFSAADRQQVDPYAPKEQGGTMDVRPEEIEVYRPKYRLSAPKP